MAALKILTGLNGSEDAATLPRERWRDLVSTRKTYCKSQFRTDCRALLFFIEDAAKNNWLGYASREQYIRDGLGLDLELVPWAIQGLKRIDPDRSVGFDEAVVLGQHGGKRQKGQGNNVTLTQRGNAPDYTLARLHRDHPALAERVKEGELSANAAAIEAGFRKRTVSVPLDPVAFVRVIRARFTSSQIQKIIEGLQ